MITIKISSPKADIAADPNVAKLKAHLSQRRMADIQCLKGKIAEKENSTGFTNYSAHVFDAAEYYMEGLKQVSQIDANGDFDETDLMTKIHIESTIAMAAKASFLSAFVAATEYSDKNIRQYKRQKIWKAVKRKLSF